jgi:hypothetical protein
MVEGIIAVGLLSILLAAVVLVHHLYAAKLATIAEARNEAWTGAMDGCGGGLIAGILDSVGVISALSAAENHDLIDAPDWVTEMGREAGDSATQTVTASAPLTAGSYQLRHSMSVPCNEFAEDEDGSLVLNLFNAIRQIVPIEF